MSNPIRTAKAWGRVHADGSLDNVAMHRATAGNSDPVHTVQGLSDEQLAAMIERDRMECEWSPIQIHSALMGKKTGCGVITGARVDTSRPCWCGKKVKLVERPAGEGC